jgi:hypothetical protein
MDHRIHSEVSPSRYGNVKLRSVRGRPRAGLRTCPPRGSGGALGRSGRRPPPPAHRPPRSPSRHRRPLPPADTAAAWPPRPASPPPSSGRTTSSPHRAGQRLGVRRSAGAVRHGAAAGGDGHNNGRLRQHHRPRRDSARVDQNSCEASSCPLVTPPFRAATAAFRAPVRSFRTGAQGCERDTGILPGRAAGLPSPEIPSAPVGAGGCSGRRRRTISRVLKRMAVVMD